MQKTEVPENRFWRSLDQVFQILCSLKLAVLVILTLAIALGVATFVESLYDTPTAQFWIYRARWFHLILSFLGINIFCVAVSRYPWKAKHIPFLLAHLGILLLLAGSWITEQKAIDGNLRISEGEVISVVELEQASLVLSEKNDIFSVPIPWLPPGVKFDPIPISSARFPFPLIVNQFESHADADVSFIQVTNRTETSPLKSGALHFRVAGGPMRISQDFWLWEGAPQWQEIQAGPAHFFLSKEKVQGKKLETNPPWIGFEIGKNGISYLAKSSDGKYSKGNLGKDQAAVGKVIHPGWKGDVTVTLLDWTPDATVLVNYKPSRIQYGTQASQSAIHVSGGSGAEVWLGLGDRANLHLGDKEIMIGYFQKRVMLPFSIRLDHFEVEHDPGTLRAAAYSSQVTVFDGDTEKKATISMNEPLQIRGYTFYQASFEDGDPRPVTSIFSVNRDPGRTWKYLGSLLIVAGSVLLFGSKYKKKLSKPVSEVKS